MTRLISQRGQSSNAKYNIIVILCGINRKLKTLENFLCVCSLFNCIFKLFCAVLCVPISLFSTLTPPYGQNKQTKIKTNRQKF